MLICVGGDPASVEDLAAAGGIERAPVENQGRTGAVLQFADLGIEVVEEGVVVVEAVGHGSRIYSNHMGHGGNGGLAT